jgi:hypothetical protein
LAEGPTQNGIPLFSRLIERNPRAPVLRSMAFRAIGSGPNAAAGRGLHAISDATGPICSVQSARHAALVLPHANVDAMNLHLAESVASSRPTWKLGEVPHKVFIKFFANSQPPFNTRPI